MKNWSPLAFLKALFIGRARNLSDQNLFHKISLVAVLAWVGLGADGLSSSCYGPEETFKALGAHSALSVFVALAPYCVPFYALAVAIGYRVLLWFKPDAGGESLFLFLLGAALGGHFFFTWDSLTQTRQPDLDAAGGALFSLTLIAIANALMILLLLKGLFPESVPLLDRLREAASLTKRFWTFAWVGAQPALSAMKRQALAW